VGKKVLPLLLPPGLPSRAPRHERCQQVPQTKRSEVANELTGSAANLVGYYAACGDAGERTAADHAVVVRQQREETFGDLLRTEVERTQSSDGRTPAQRRSA
ncbi:unnamed protein product, partial [Ectocarpus sp. 6 AP-2014]